MKEPKFHVYDDKGQRLTTKPLTEAELREYTTSRNLVEGKGEGRVTVRQILQG